MSQVEAILGITYKAGGNLAGETGEPISLPVEPKISFFRIQDGERILMEYSSLTGKSVEIKVPQF